MDSTFSDLLQRAEQLTADMETTIDLPRIERNLPQLAEATQRLLSRTWNAGDDQNVKASLLLSTKGVELPKLSRRLESLNATKSFEPIEPVVETDIHSFLKNEQENAMLSVIEETKKRTFANSEKCFWESLDDEWERDKQRILNSLLSNKEAMCFPVDTGRFEESSIVKGRSSLSALQMSFAHQVYACNEQSIQRKQEHFLNPLKQVGQKSDDLNARELWLLFEELLPIDRQIEKDVRKYRQSVDFQYNLVKNAMRFLEGHYRNFIEKSVYDNLQKAELGGTPGLYNLVLSFLKIKMPPTLTGFENGTVNSVPVWPFVYYCLRCGDVSATQQAAETLPPQFSEFKTFLKEFLDSPDRRVCANSEAKIQLQYKRTIRESTDPFKRIVFCIIGRCGTTDSHSEVIKKTEDYIWLKLSQLQINENETSSLQDLQRLLLEEYGEGHFKALDHPYLYCQVLFLTGQFEAGIEFLSRIDHCRTHAIHMAIVLNSLNILLVPNIVHAPLLSVDSLDKPPMRRLNFARLITLYTRKFECTDPRDALEYFYLLRNFTGPNGDNLFAACVSELVLESREFEMILGCIGLDGTKKIGCISKFNLDVQQIVDTIAKAAESKGQYEDAVMMYDLADNNEKVLELLNNLLCQLVPLANSPQSSRERMQTVARAVAERYKTRGHNGSRTRSSTFYLIIDLMYFFDLYHEQETAAALDVIQKMKLIPLSIEEVEQKVVSFKQYSNEVRQCLPDVLLTTMTILYSKYKKRKASVQNFSLLMSSDKEESVLEELRKEARALVTFAGLLPYRMPGDTNARLVQFEIMMN